MKRLLAALALGALLTLPAARAVTLTLDGQVLDSAAPVYNDTTFVPLRTVVQALCPGAQVEWTGDRAAVYAGDLELTAAPGDDALVCNGERISLPAPVRLEDCRTLVPVRPLAALFGARVDWDPLADQVALTTAAPMAAEEEVHDDDAVYWLSRVISAESQGECWEGKVAVGNVVLNRVKSPDFPDTIYGVIFDDRWGGQFEPVRNGSIYHEPTRESVQAAIACLNGENTVGESLYFLAPDLTDNHWTMENRTYVTTIGAHWFYL